MTRKQSVRVKLQAGYPTHKAAIDALWSEIERISRSEFNAEAVPGSILAAFDRDWPCGLCWADEPLWDQRGPDKSAMYHIESTEMDWDDGGHALLGELVYDYWKENIRE